MKNSVSKDVFDKSFLDIFFVHFGKVKILFIFRKLAFLYNILKKQLKAERLFKEKTT